MTDEFVLHLRSHTNRHGIHYSDGTLHAYRAAVTALDTWMTREAVDGDFTACEAGMLNRFFADYLREHSQGGVNTKQRNLRHFFTWLEKEYGHPHPYKDADLNRYRPPENKPATLAGEFLEDLLRVTSGPGFGNRRDHAIIRVLMSGMRRTECAQMDLDGLDLANHAARVVPLKGARTRAAQAGRVVPLGDKATLAIHRYLRERATQRYARSGWLWLGTRGRSRLTGHGIWRMLRRRAEQAGYDPRTVHTHMFRHTFAHEFLADEGSEGDLMRLMGWRDRSMIDRYAADLAEQRALAAAARHAIPDRY
jgi:site-specific recombinase XerD